MGKDKNELQILDMLSKIAPDKWVKARAYKEINGNYCTYETKINGQIATLANDWFLHSRSNVLYINKAKLQFYGQTVDKIYISVVEYYDEMRRLNNLEKKNNAYKCVLGKIFNY